MLKVTVSGAKNDVNVSYSLATASAAGGTTFIIFNGQLLDVVAASPLASQYTLVGTALTVGTAPAATDSLFAFISTSLQSGMVLTAVTGTQDAANTVFSLASAPPASSNVFLAFNGAVQEEVAAAPGVNQFTISGTTITFGLAPAATDVLVAYVQEAASVFFQEVVTTGAQDGGNTRFAIPFVYAAGYSPLLLVVHNGLILQETTANSMANQFVVSTRAGTTTVALGLAPSSSDSLQIHTIGVTRVPGVTTLLNLRSLERRLIVLLAGSIDAEESRLCLDSSFRSLLSEHVFSFMKNDGVISTIATKTGGTLSVTQGNIMMLGTGTSPSVTDTGGYFLLNHQPYRIVSVDVANQIYIVDAPFAGATNATTTYTLYQNLYALDPDVTQIITMAGANWDLEQKSRQYLDMVDPSRDIFGEPYYYAYRGPGSTGIEQIELWPIPNARYSLRYQGMRRSALDTSGQTIFDISEVLLKFGASVGCRMVANKMAMAEKWNGTSHWDGQAQTWYQDATVSLQQWLKRDRTRWGRNQKTRDNFNNLRGRTDIDLGY